MTKSPFDKDGGAFAENIRSIVGLNDKGLRDSMQSKGWVTELPALADENGVILVGNRRMKIAKELGIEPVIKTLEFGAGTDADAERVKLAVASNAGGKNLSKDDRKNIAWAMYDGHGWTMEVIAQALGVSIRQVSRDLDGFDIMSKPDRPKGGRPKGSKKKGEEMSRPSPETDRAREIVRPLVEAGLAVSRQKLAEEHGLSEKSIQAAAIAERARKAALEEEPQVTREMLSLTAQEKFDAAIKRERKNMDRLIDERARDLARTLVEDTILPSYIKSKEEYDSLVKCRQGAMTKAEYNLIRACLHPDGSMSADKRQRAWDLFSSVEIALLDETQMPTSSFKIPTRYDDLMEIKRQRSAVKRSGNKAVGASLF